MFVDKTTTKKYNNNNLIESNIWKRLLTISKYPNGPNRR